MWGEIMKEILCKYTIGSGIHCNGQVKYEMHPDGIYGVCQENEIHKQKCNPPTVEEERLAYLIKDSDFLPDSFLRSYWGLNVSELEFLSEKIKKWSNHLYPDKLIINDQGRLSRFISERYFNSLKTIPRNYAASQLGLRPETLAQLADFLIEQGFPPNNIDAFGKKILYQKRFIEYPLDLFKGTRYHNYDKRHEVISLIWGELEKIGIDISYEKENYIDEKGKPDTYEIDIITHKPIGIPSIWLQINKPHHFTPDRVSSETLRKYEEQLYPFTLEAIRERAQKNQREESLKKS